MTVCLTHLFDTILQQGYVPNDFGFGRMIALLKSINFHDAKT